LNVLLPVPKLVPGRRAAPPPPDTPPIEPPPSRSIAALVPLLLTGGRADMIGAVRGVSLNAGDNFGALPLLPLIMLTPELPPLFEVLDFVVGQPAAGELPLQPLTMLTPELPPPPFGVPDFVVEVLLLLLTMLMPELPPPPFGSALKIGDGFLGSPALPDFVVGQPAAGELPLQPLAYVTPELPPPPFGSPAVVGGFIGGAPSGRPGLSGGRTTGPWPPPTGAGNVTGIFGSPFVAVLVPELLTGGLRMPAPGLRSAQGGLMKVSGFGGTRIGMLTRSPAGNLMSESLSHCQLFGVIVMSFPEPVKTCGFPVTTLQ
jgi:hypothetical protein